MALFSGPMRGVIMVLYVKVGTSTVGKTLVSALTTVCGPPSTSPEGLQRRVYDHRRVPQVQLAQAQQQVPQAYRHLSSITPGCA